MTLPANTLRRDLQLVAEMVPAGARVLDIGCGTGDLLAHLRETKSVDGRGIELRPSRVNACLAKGLSVIQGDADRDLETYPAGAFDVAILSQTLQATREPAHVLEHLARVAGTTIVSFPNFGFWRVRLSLLFNGRMPVTGSLPHKWFDTPNIHLCTVADFTDLCADLSLSIEEAVAILPGGGTRRITGGQGSTNWFAETAIFRLTPAEVRA